MEEIGLNFLCDDFWQQIWHELNHVRVNATKFSEDISEKDWKQ